MKLPDSVILCLGIGAQKAGTTWLAAYLDAHPAVFMSPIKELHYFDAMRFPELMEKRDEHHLAHLKNLAKAVSVSDVRSRATNWTDIAAHYDRLEMIGGGFDKYLEFFAKRVGDRRVAAEVTPGYSLLSAADFRDIKGLHPHVKLVFLMRNPIDRVWSAIRHLERGSVRPERPFENVVSWNGLRLRTDYRHTLTALDESFPAEDVFVAFYEEFFTEASIRRLCAFLSIPYHPAAFDKVVNQGAQRTMTAYHRQRLGDLLRPVYAYCHERFGDRLPDRWRADMTAIS